MNAGSAPEMLAEYRRANPNGRRTSLAIRSVWRSAPSLPVTAQAVVSGPLQGAKILGIRSWRAPESWPEPEKRATTLLAEEACQRSPRQAS